MFAWMDTKLSHICINMLEYLSYVIDNSRDEFQHKKKALLTAFFKWGTKDPISLCIHAEAVCLIMSFAAHWQNHDTAEYDK